MKGKLNRPRADQLSLVSVTIVGNVQAAFYSTRTSDEVILDYLVARGEGKVLRIDTGDRTDEARDSVILIPTDSIVLLAVAKINHIELSHGILV